MRNAAAPLATLLLCFGATALLSQDSPVTDTERVRVGGSRTELLRKINGRWWTQDNRLVHPPKERNTFAAFWIISSKPGVVEFYHHRPFDVRRGEQLRLFLTPEEVEAAFGQPNRRFPMGSARGGRWYYHGSDGTILDLWFLGGGELGQAEYNFPNGQKRSVAAIEQELNGRSIFSVMAQRAGQRTTPTRSASGRPVRTASLQSVEVPRAVEPARPAQLRIVTREAAASIQPGALRGDLLLRLGQPSFRSSISGEDGVRETFTYHLDEHTPIAVRLLNGKVIEVR